jgi:hypothetical protein
MAGAPDAAGRPARAWHAAALLAFGCAAWLNMRGWLDPELLPPGDFAGYAAVVEQVRDALLRYGRVPAWCSRCFGGASYFVSSGKEILAFPLAVWLDPVSATKALFAILRVVSAFLLYWLFARRFAAPAVGIAAGYAFAFGTFSNHQVHALDVPVSAALLAAVPLASLRLFERGSRRTALGLGLLAACLIANNWVQALVGGVLFVVVGLLVCGRPLVAARVRLLGVTLATCLAFSASWIAWTLADSGHHQLVDREVVREQSALLSERSPFLLVNRDGVLSRWLDAHDPFAAVPRARDQEVPPISVSDGERRYLGIVAIAVVVAGALAVRRDPALRGWFAAGALAMLFQYWMALGSHTLVWLVGRSFGVSDSVDLPVRIALGAIALACLARRRFGLALLAVFPALPVWSMLRAALPLLESQRSPGHFIDVLPLSWALLIGVSLVALARRAGRRRAHALVAGVALLVAIDYWPSRRAFQEGAPVSVIRDARALVAGLDGEDGSLRIHLAPSGPGPSLVASGSQLGWARGWLGWQAGRGWLQYMIRAYWTFHPGRASALPPGHERLLEIARVRYLLMLDHEATRVVSHAMRPWTRIGGTSHFSLWEQPNVGPMALGYRELALVAGAREGAALPLVAPLHARNLLAASVERLDEHPELADAAALVFWSGLVRPGDASERIAERHAGKLVDIGGPAPDPRWPALLRGRPPAETFDVRYQRIGPEHVRIALDAGAAPAYVFVSEGYHPWWRAVVDAVPAPVLRAHAVFMAVPAPAGAREIELRFTPPLLVRAADALTRLAWLAAPVAALVFAAQRLRARPQTRSGAPG